MPERIEILKATQSFSNLRDKPSLTQQIVIETGTKRKIGVMTDFLRQDATR
jgi:hypothetical protein